MSEKTRIAITPAVGEFTAKPAPDETWFLRGDPWPTIGLLVEVCWARRDAATKELLPYVYGRAFCKEYASDGMSSWRLESGSDLIFSPDFWRPAHAGN